MKKQLKTTILAIGLLASVTGAFASDISNALSGKKEFTHNWQQYDRETGEPIGPVIPGTSANPFLSECNSATEIKCAEGTPIGGGTPIVVKYSL